MVQQCNNAHSHFLILPQIQKKCNIKHRPNQTKPKQTENENVCKCVSGNDDDNDVDEPPI